ncbi:MAG: GatB/YqeY domain-containing protein [Bacteroidota bacterium]
MSLKQQIESDIKQAMLAKDKDGLRALRAIKSLILLEATKDGAAAELAPEEEIKLLTKAVKQRRDSAEIYRTQNRPDLLEAEMAEISVIERYLPKQLSEDEVKARLQEIISQVGAKSPADMGKVMGVATKELAGLAEGKTISALVKSLLG